MKTEILTTDLIKETGFESWGTFYLALLDAAPIDGKTEYHFVAPDGTNKKQLLPLDIGQLQSLAYYDSLNYIRPVAASFEELYNRLGDGQDAYNNQFITQNENGEVELHKIYLRKEDIQKLAALEQNISVAFIKTVEKRGHHNH